MKIPGKKKPTNPQTTKNHPPAVCYEKSASVSYLGTEQVFARGGEEKEVTPQLGLENTEGRPLKMKGSRESNILRKTKERPKTRDNYIT